MVPIFATIVLIVIFIYFQQQIYKRHTKSLENKTRKRYDKGNDEPGKEKKDDEKKEDYS